MEKEKKKKILKICLWSLFAAALVAIITMSIVSSVYKNNAQKLKEKNDNVENVLYLK